ncbi:MAG: hypothetical protein NW241_01650 [Bacteroidia bacterium]|nr:hypothetical protein [Bacteroidia bacterium]
MRIRPRRVSTAATERLLSVLLLIAGQAAAQPFSGWGQVHTPAGDLHLLVIFVRFEDAKRMNGDAEWPDVSVPGALPRMAQGPENAWFYADTGRFAQGPRVKNLSDYYYTMSGGAFRITADVYPLQVPVRNIPETGGNFFSRQVQLNQAAVHWIAEHDPEFDWGRYDRRTNRPAYRRDNRGSPPDGILDYVVFMYRDFGSTGMGGTGSLQIPGSALRIADGHTGIKSYADAEHNWEYFKHEFAHNLYDCPHYLGANSADGTRFYTQKGWGMMAAWHAPFYTANAWECWWMNWLEPQEITASGRYLLRDFATGRDAVRIRLPGSDQTLWLENHQKLDPWDGKLFYTSAAAGEPQSAPGLYAYVVAEPGTDRSRPQLNSFDPRHANMIRMFNGAGSFDYAATRDTHPSGNPRAPVFTRLAPNPIAGQNDFQFIRYDYNGDGRIRCGRRHGNLDAGGREEMDVWVEQLPDGSERRFNSTGNEDDALLPGDEIGLSGRFPALNYPEYDPKLQQLEPYRLSGICVRVLERLPDGTLALDIRLEDWTLRRSARWCGRVLLPGGAVLRSTGGAAVTLEPGGTASRETPHPETGTFAAPAELRMEAGSTWVLEAGSSLDIRQHAALRLDSGAVLRLEPGAQLRVHAGGTVQLAAGAYLETRERRQILLHAEGRLLMEQPARQIRYARWRRTPQTGTTQP